LTCDITHHFILYIKLSPPVDIYSPLHFVRVPKYFSKAAKSIKMGMTATYFDTAILEVLSSVFMKRRVF
jgi:hypothetical protein